MLSVTALRALKRIADGKPAFGSFATNKLIRAQRYAALEELRARRYITAGPKITETGRAYLTRNLWVEIKAPSLAHAERYGLSRTAVWSRVSRTRREFGHEL